MVQISLDEALEFVFSIANGDEYFKRWVKEQIYKKFDEDLFLAHIKTYNEELYKAELLARRPDQYAIEYPEPEAPEADEEEP